MDANASSRRQVSRAMRAVQKTHLCGGACACSGCCCPDVAIPRIWRAMRCVRWDFRGQSRDGRRFLSAETRVEGTTGYRPRQMSQTRGRRFVRRAGRRRSPGRRASKTPAIDTGFATELHRAGCLNGTSVNDGGVGGATRPRALARGRRDTGMCPVQCRRTSDGCCRSSRANCE
jgi:hypothetical protein